MKEKERDKIFDEIHNSPVGKHRGIVKPHDRISKKYFWPNLRKDKKLYRMPDQQNKTRHD